MPFAISSTRFSLVEGGRTAVTALAGLDGDNFPAPRLVRVKATVDMLQALPRHRFCALR